MEQLVKRDVKEILRITKLNKGMKAYKIAKAYYELNPCEEIWTNTTYIVHVRRNLEVPGMPLEQTDGKERPTLMTHLSIKRNDNRAIIDWREFQWIKNQLCGDECVGVEIYPKESHLVDTANQFHIWVFEEAIHLPFGWTTRIVSDKETAAKNSTQRKFPENRKPIDNEQGVEYLDKCDEILHDSEDNKSDRINESYVAPQFQSDVPEWSKKVTND